MQNQNRERNFSYLLFLMIIAGFLTWLATLIKHHEVRISNATDVATGNSNRVVRHEL